MGAVIASVFIGIAAFYRKKLSKHQVYLEKSASNGMIAESPHSKDQSLWIDRRWGNRR